MSLFLAIHILFNIFSAPSCVRNLDYSFVWFDLGFVYLSLCLNLRNKFLVVAIIFDLFINLSISSHSVVCMFC